MKKLLSIVLSAALVVGLLPGQVLAAGRRYMDEVELPAVVTETPLGKDIAAEVPALPAEPPADPDELPAQLAEGERTVVASGSCGADGDNLTWTLYSDGELYIVGSGAMADYASGNAPWYTDYQAQITSAVLEAGVTGIGDHAFSDCRSLTSVTIPGSVTSIGDYAFSSCSALTSVNIPEGVADIRSGTFFQCTELTSIVIPEGVTSIGDSAFDSCYQLASILIPESVTHIGDYAFSSCFALASVTIPEGVADIRSGTFFQCTELTSIVIPEGVTSIGDSAFGSCYQLASILIPGSVTHIGDYAFSSCFALASIAIPEGVTSIGGSAFYGCSALTAVNIPEGVTSIGNSAFSGCSSLSSVVIHEGVTSIGDSAFTLCVSLTSVTIPEGVTSIGRNAFCQCSALASVTIPESVTSIEAYAFCGCSALVSITIPQGVTLILDSTFSGCSSLSSVIIPDEVTCIGNGAFDGCSSLTDVVFPRSLTRIESQAFSDCSALTGVTFHKGLDYIGYGAFDGCSSLTTAEFLGNAPIMDFSAFPGQEAGDFLILYHRGTANWTSPMCQNCYTDCVDAPKDYSALDDDGRNAQHIFFTLDEASRTATVGDNSAYPNNAGYNGSDGGVATIPETVTKNGKSYRVTEVGQQAFSGNRMLKAVRLGDHIFSVDVSAFQGCASLEQFVVSGKNASYCSDQWGVLYTKDRSTLVAYPSARKWPYYNVSDKTVQIESGAFQECENLKNLYIPRSVVSMYRCINSCPGMTICAYLDSEAYRYAESNDLDVWRMDNYVLQGLEIYSLPEQQAFRMGSEDFSGLYLAANGGKALQADGYTLSYDPNRTGLQTVTVSYQGLRASFPILLYGATDQLLDFGGLDLPDGATAYAAVYHTDGKMTRLEQITVLGGKAQFAVPKNVYDTMGEAKLFVLQNGSFVPLQAQITISH